MRTKRFRRTAAIALCLAGLVPLGGCYLTLTETGPKVVCERSDYVFVQQDFGGAYLPVNEWVGVFCPGYAVP